MPFFGNNFARSYSWQADAAAGIPIEPARIDADSNDIAGGLSRLMALATGPFTGYVAVTPLNEPQTATAGQTVFTLSTFSYAQGIPNAISVYVDGIKLPASDVTQTSSTSVTVATAMLGGEQVEIVSGNFSSIMGGKVAAQHTQTAINDVASYQFRRNVELPGGTAGFVNSCIRADTFVDNTGATGYEWAIVGVVHNQATAGQNVGGYFQGIKYASAGPTWGSTSEVIDQNVSNPTSGVVGMEVDVTADGTDTNGARIGVDIVWRNRTGASMEAAYGLRLNGSDANATLKVGIGATPGAKLGIGIDLSGATISGAAVNLVTNQAINFGGNAGVPANTRRLFHNGSTYVFSNSSGTSYWGLNDNGSLVALGVQLLGARQTGYAAMTGVTNRGTVYDPSTITLAQLAARVNALQADLTLHGLIGA